MDYHPIQGGVEILLVTSCYRNWDKFQSDRPLGTNADFTLHVRLEIYISLHLSHQAKILPCLALTHWFDHVTPRVTIIFVKI